MNYATPSFRDLLKYTHLDFMLADVAVSIQLSPTDYQKAVDHYNAINDWLDREDSPLHGHVQAFYPQGGFSIGATTARYATDDEFDIDAMAQLALRTDVDPEYALALLHKAIRGEKGSRYYDKVDRKTRCSTVQYDGMHLDVTPAVRLASTSEKTSLIFHSKPGDPNEPKMSLHANPFGFAEWFKLKTPADATFGAFYEARSLDFERERLLAEADATPVPEQMPVYHKSKAVIALQLIKRWRNLAYDRRHPRLRRPPSVLLSFYVATHANRCETLSEELIHQASCILATLEKATARNETVRAFNPSCVQDELTDRWPASLQDQEIFSAELKGFIASLKSLEHASLDQMQRVLEDLFGEKPARNAITRFVESQKTNQASGRASHLTGKGAVPTLGSATASNVRSTPSNKFFGD